MLSRTKRCRILRIVGGKVYLVPRMGISLTQTKFNSKFRYSRLEITLNENQNANNVYDW